MLSLFLVAVLATGACGAKKTITVWVLGASNFVPGYNKLFADFEKENPDIKVNRIDMGWEELSTKLTTAFATGGELPDLTEVPVTFVSPFIKLGLFAPVPESVMTKAESEEKYWLQTLAFLLEKGKYYGLPATYTTDKIGVLYNKKLWRQAGVQPENAKTWEDFMKIAQKLTKRDATGNIIQVGLLNHGGEEEETFFGWTLQYGGKVLTEDGKRMAFNSPEGRKALQTYVDVPDKWKVDDPKFPVDAFSKEQVASQLIGPYQGFILKQDFPSIEWGFFPQPKLTDKPPYFVLTVDWVRLVPKSSRNKDETFKWLKFMTDDKRAVYWALVCGEFPPLKKASQDPEILKDPALGPLAPLLQYGVAIDLKNANRFREMLYNVLDEILFHKISIDEGLAKMEREGNLIFEEYDALYER